MKKIAIRIWVGLMSVVMTTEAVLAQTQQQKSDKAALDKLFKGSTQTKELKNLPGGTKEVDILSDSIPGLIQFSLQLAGIVALAVAVYAGILLVTGRGDEEALKKGKEILVYAAVAVVIISSAFALVSGLVSFRF